MPEERGTHYVSCYAQSHHTQTHPQQHNPSSCHVSLNSTTPSNVERERDRNKWRSRLCLSSSRQCQVVRRSKRLVAVDSSSLESVISGFKSDLWILLQSATIDISLYHHHISGDSFRVNMLVQVCTSKSCDFSTFYFLKKRKIWFLFQISNHDLSFINGFFFFLKMGFFHYKNFRVRGWYSSLR